MMLPTSSTYASNTAAVQNAASVYRLSRPGALSPEEQPRWDESMRRMSILGGTWQLLARNAIRSFFAREMADQIKAERPDLSVNPLLFYATQLSTLYHRPPRVTVSEDEGDLTAEEMSLLTPVELWAHLHQLNRDVVALNDGVLRLDYNRGRERVSYRQVSNHCICGAVPSEGDPMQPVRLKELYWRDDPDSPAGGWWTWETWDVTDPKNPIFKIEAVDQQGVKSDMTAKFMPDGFPAGGYPYLDKDGNGIMPYVFYHRRLQYGLWTPAPGLEVVEGTLTVAALRSFWAYSYRSASSPQNYGLNVEPLGASPTKDTGSQGGGRQMVGGPGSLALFRTTAQGGGFGQLAPALDPLTGIKALQQYQADLAVFMGLSPADVTTESVSSASGASLRVRKEGQRKEANAQQPSFRASDQLTLASSARLLNAFHPSRPNFPEDRDAYDIGYYEPDLSPDEVKARTERAKQMKELGVANRVDLLRVFHPEMSRAAAKQHIVMLATEEAEMDDEIAEAVGEEVTPDEDRADLEDRIEMAASDLEDAEDALQDLISALPENLRGRAERLLEALSDAADALTDDDGRDGPPDEGEE